jgi:hypothetical protein
MSLATDGRMRSKLRRETCCSEFVLRRRSNTACSLGRPLSWIAAPPLGLEPIAGQITGRWRGGRRLSPGQDRTGKPRLVRGCAPQSRPSRRTCGRGGRRLVRGRPDPEGWKGAAAQGAVGGTPDAQVPQQRRDQCDTHVGGNEGDQCGAVRDDVPDARNEAGGFAGLSHDRVHAGGRVVVGNKAFVAQIGQVEVTVDGRRMAARRSSGPNYAFRDHPPAAWARGRGPAQRHSCRPQRRPATSTCTARSTITVAWPKERQLRRHGQSAADAPSQLERSCFSSAYEAAARRTAATMLS